jgi:outer membrane assembly lipoprotein YfgL
VNSLFSPLPVKLARSLAAVALIAAVAACSSTDKIKPADLTPNLALQAVRSAWTSQIGAVNFSLEPNVFGTTVTLAASDGTVAALDATTGKDLWRVRVDAPITAGVGSDGKTAAVVTNANEVVALAAGRVLWRQKLPAQGYTPPLVAGGRVFVVTADRSVMALDGASGRKIWTQQRPGDALVLKQSGVLLAVGDTLVVGQSGRLLGLNPANGSVRWDAPIATSRGTNDVERLIDLVGPVSRVGNGVCARAFQATVGCVDAVRGQVLWSKKSVGAVGLHGDEKLVIGAEADDKLVAWNRADGERVWSSDLLLHRVLSAPLLLGKSVVVGDSTGLLHLLSRENASPVNRVETDGSAISVSPVLAGKTIVVVTSKGGVYGFVSE